MIRPDFTAQERRKLEIAAGIASSCFPYLGGIYAKLDIRFEDRIDTAGVTESGKLLINRKFFDELAPGVETAFLLAHESPLLGGSRRFIVTHSNSLINMSWAMLSAS